MHLNINIKRGEKIESTHTAFAVAVDEAGEIICSIGNPNYTTCIRSSLKPFQACAGISSGAFSNYKLTNKEIALTCSSHSAEHIHTKTALGILNKINLKIYHSRIKKFLYSFRNPMYFVYKKNIPFP